MKMIKETTDNELERIERRKDLILNTGGGCQYHSRLVARPAGSGRIFEGCTEVPNDTYYILIIKQKQNLATR